MESKIVYKSSPNCRRLIIIFAGWSTSPQFYSDLHAEGWDIAVVWNYTSLDLDSSFIDNYNTVFIIAWSLGVAAAASATATSFDASKITAAFAVNGTLFPSSDEYGIPCNIYEATRSGLNARSLLKFTKRMGYTFADARQKESTPHDIEIPDFYRLDKELITIRSIENKENLPWKRVYISENDRIFPPSNMINYWSSHDSNPEIILLNAPHYVHLQSIIDDITPDYARIGARFEKALSTYDENAAAQRIIVDNLVNMIADTTLPQSSSILEIGSGSGLLSYALSKRIHPAKAVFVDLYPTPVFNIAPEEEYVVADAESWIADFPDSHFDIIASSNTIQWFADPENFFKQAARTLRSDGILLCSSFLAGNLKELDDKRPSPLLYHTLSELREMLGRYFKDVDVSSEPIILRFNSRRELLLHLKSTGVGGGNRLHTAHSDKARRSIREGANSVAQNSLPLTLTYLPVYIKATNPTI